MINKNAGNISMAVIRRLPKYHRYLKDLLDKDIQRISSKELSGLIGFTASQIRQDLNCFGGFGQQGYGYNIEELYNELSKILGLDIKYNVIIIGAGNLGQAIANYTDFQKLGFNLIGLFDSNPKLVGMKINDVLVMDIDELEEFTEINKIDIAVISTPKDAAQNIVKLLKAENVKGIWNFSPEDLEVEEGIIVENVHLSESLFTLSYLLKEKDILEKEG